MKWNEIFYLEGSVSYAVVRGGVTLLNITCVSFTGQGGVIFYNTNQYTIYNASFNSVSNHTTSDQGQGITPPNHGIAIAALL